MDAPGETYPRKTRRVTRPSTFMRRHGMQRYAVPESGFNRKPECDGPAVAGGINFSKL